MSHSVSRRPRCHQWNKIHMAMIRELLRSVLWLCVLCGLVTFNGALSEDNTCSFDFSGRRDVIIVFDTRVGNDLINQSRVLMESLIKKTMELDYNKTEVAVVTFDSKVREPINSIGMAIMYPCEFFDPRSPWFKDIIYREQGNGSLQAALDRALAIHDRVDVPLDVPRDVPLDVIVITDASNVTLEKNYSNSSAEFPDRDLFIYGMGVGNSTDEGLFKTNIVTDPSCYKTLTEWMEFVQNISSTTTSSSGDVMRQTVDPNLCIPTCVTRMSCVCSTTQDFACQNFNYGTPPTPTSALPTPTSELTLLTILSYIFYGLMGLFLLAMLIACTCCLYNVGTSHARSTAQQEMTVNEPKEGSGHARAHNQYTTSPESYNLAVSTLPSPRTQHSDLAPISASTLPKPSISAPTEDGFFSNGDLPPAGRDNVPLPTIPGNEPYDEIESLIHDRTPADSRDYMKPVPDSTTHDYMKPIASPMAGTGHFNNALDSTSDDYMKPVASSESGYINVA